MENTLEHLAVITANYPTSVDVYRGRFVEQLVEAIAQTGRTCSVIHPIKVRIARPHRSRPAGPPPGMPEVSVLRPRFVSLGAKRIGPINTAHVTQFCFEQAARRAIRRLPRRPEVVYGHFMYSSGAAAVRIATSMGLPSVVAVGESSFWGAKSIGLDRARSDFRDVTGVVAVSSFLKRQLTSQIGIPPERIRVFPNGVDLTRFFPRDRTEMRRKYGLAPEKFIVAFVGHFDHRKGVLRVAEALDGLNDVGGVFIGAGALEVDSPRMLFRGTLSHGQIPEMLSAADLFVLPTLAEGSCNAIIEAMACGLPVVTSSGEFNDDIVDDSVAIRLDPLDVRAIRGAIIALKEDAALRRRMGTAAFERSQQMDVNTRAEQICSWIASLRRHS